MEIPHVSGYAHDRLLDHSAWTMTSCCCCGLRWIWAAWSPIRLNIEIQKKIEVRISKQTAGAESSHDVRCTYVPKAWLASHWPWTSYNPWGFGIICRLVQVKGIETGNFLSFFQTHFLQNWSWSAGTIAGASVQKAEGTIQELVAGGSNVPVDSWSNSPAIAFLLWEFHMFLGSEFVIFVYNKWITKLKDYFWELNLRTWFAGRLYQQLLPQKA